MMIGEVINLASYGSFGGGDIGNILAQWEAAGIFAYALPFLLIFALIFGLLTKLNIFGAKGANADPNSGKSINAIIALASSLMALQFDLVSIFFAEIFPKLGVALSIILVLLILGGLFIPTNKESNWFMTLITVIAFVIVAVVVYGSFQGIGYGFGGGAVAFFLRQYAPILIFFAIIVVVVVATNRKKDPQKLRLTNMLSRALGED
jgi:hypothetical protein